VERINKGGLLNRYDLRIHKSPRSATRPTITLCSPSPAITVIFGFEHLSVSLTKGISEAKPDEVTGSNVMHGAD